ncbi:MAG: CinA family protein [Clostridia bacterium]
MQKLVDKLIKFSRTISTMELCNGGTIAYNIKNIEGDSTVFKYGKDNIIHTSIYGKINNHYYEIVLTAKDITRIETKEIIVNAIISKMMEIL